MLTQSARVEVLRMIVTKDGPVRPASARLVAEKSAARGEIAMASCPIPGAGSCASLSRESGMSTRASHRPRRPVMVAMVLGTALSALSAQQLHAAEVETSGQAVRDIGRYCTSCWRNARLPVDAWGDCTQE